MIYFEISLSNGDKIIIKEEELKGVVEAIKAGGNVIITSGGIFNGSFYVGIGIAKERMEEIKELERYGQKYVERPSEFARLLSGKFQMLTPAQRTEAQEEAAKKERELKSG